MAEVTKDAIEAGTRAYIAHADVYWRDHLQGGIQGAVHAALVAANPELVSEIRRLREELLHTSRVLAAERATCVCDDIARKTS